MTAEDRYIVDIEDIREVRLECGTCGTAVVFRAADWDKFPTQCPGCGVSWHHGDHTPEAQGLSRLSMALRAFGANAPQRMFRVRLGLDRPKN